MQYTIQPLRIDRSKFPAVTYFPVLEHFGVAPRVNSQGEPRASWAIYHHSGMIIGGYFPGIETAVAALFKLQQSTEFQTLVKLSKENPNADNFPGFDPTILLQQILDLEF